MSCVRTCSVTSYGVPACCVSAALATMRLKYPASATVTAFSRRAQPAIWDTARPTASSSANVVTSAGRLIVSRS
jgi:hypothetical protein